VLHFTLGDERRSIGFRRGHIVKAHTSVTTDRLGETLVRHGLLTAEQFELAQDKVIREKKRMGLVLQELSIMDKDGVEDALALHVRENLLKVFAWSDGTYELEEQSEETPPEDDLSLRLSTGEMILEAVRRVQDADVIRYALGDIDRVLVLSSDPLLRFQKITLTPNDGYVLSRVDGVLSAREIIQMIPLPPEDTLKSLFGFLCTGVVEFQPGQVKRAPKPKPQARPAPTPPSAPLAPPLAPTTAPGVEPQVMGPARTVGKPDEPDKQILRREILEAYAGLKTKNHFEILGIKRASSEAEVKEAYFKLVKRFHPDAQRDPALAELRDKLDAVFIRLGEACEVLRNPKTRAAYEGQLADRLPPPAPVPVQGESMPPPDPAVATRMAEVSIRQAEKRFVEEKYFEAIQLLENAIPSVQGKTLLAAEVLLAKVYVKNPNWVKRAEELLQSVVHRDPKNAEAYLVLGSIYKTSGLKSRAISMFRRVLELKPENEQALSELGSLETPTQSAPAPAGGLLKKIFKKT